MPSEPPHAEPHRRTGLAMLVVAWALVFAGIFWFFDGWYRAQYNPNPHPEGASAQVVLERNRAGHYVAGGTINGERVTFLLDTGATDVALPKGLADRLKLRAGSAVSVVTANGTVVGYATRLDSVRLGALELRNVAAVVSPGLDEHTVLLGMSFLKKVEFTQRGEQLILRPLGAGPN
ncbi:MAG: retropepsin-like aspartic protease family protein [Burkholderiales bacterium]